MKSFAILAAVAGVTVAQTLGPCAQICADNMARIANTQFSCGAGDISCFCTKSNWAFGIRDCSQQACGTEESAQAVTWAASQCASVASSVSPSASLSALPILSSAVASASSVALSISARVSSAISAGQSSIAITTVPLVATITSGTNVVTTTTGFSTVYSGLTGSAANRASSVAASLNSQLSSVLASASSAVSSAAASASDAAESAASSASEAANSATGAASSTVSPGAAPRMTGLPVVAGAGLAALFLL